MLHLLLFVGWLRQLLVLVVQVTGQFAALPDLLLDSRLVPLLDLVLQFLRKLFLFGLLVDLALLSDLHI